MNCCPQDRRPLAELPDIPTDLMKQVDKSLADSAQDEAEMNNEFLKASLFVFFGGVIPNKLHTIDALALSKKNVQHDGCSEHDIYC